MHQTAEETRIICWLPRQVNLAFVLFRIWWEKRQKRTTLACLPTLIDHPRRLSC